MAYKLRFLLPLLALMAAGCGAASGAGTRAQLIAKADPICASASVERAKANARLGHATSLNGPKTLATVANTASSVAGYEREAVSKLRKLTAPASLAGDWRTMLAGLQQLADDTAQLGVYAGEKNVKAAEKLIAGSKSIRKELLAIAARDGFKNCGRND